MKSNYKEKELGLIILFYFFWIVITISDYYQDGEIRFFNWFLSVFLLIMIFTFLFDGIEEQYPNSVISKLFDLSKQISEGISDNLGPIFVVLMIISAVTTGFTEAIFGNLVNSDQLDLVFAVSLGTLLMSFLFSLMYVILVVWEKDKTEEKETQEKDIFANS